LGGDLLVVRSTSSPAAPASIGFRQDASFYYFTGVGPALGAALILDGSAKRAELFLPAQLPPSAQFFVPRQPPAARAIPDSFHVNRVSDWRELAAYVDARLASNPRTVIRVDDGGESGRSGGTLGTPLDSLAPLENPYLAWRRAIQRRWPTAQVRADHDITSLVRSVKDAGEIATLRRVADASAQALRAALPRFAPGRRQREVEAAIVETCTRLGDGPSFWPWVMSGPNAVFPTPFTSLGDEHNLDRVMQSGEVARLDLGCAIGHYMGDVGRTVPVSGRFTPGQAEVIDLLVAAYRAGLGLMRDGTPVAKVIQASVAEVARRQSSLRTALGKEAAATITRPDGIPFWQVHGIGLESAEPLPDTLRAGMVLDYEPIFSAGGQGFYMEDMILVTRTGFEILTKSLPYSAAEIELLAGPRPRR
jgi:Xaa-Pro aminopeptidase